MRNALSCTLALAVALGSAACDDDNAPHHGHIVRPPLLMPNQEGLTKSEKKVEAPKPAPKVEEKKAEEPPPPKPGVSFTFPDDGARVFTSFHATFAVEGKALSPAGENVEDEGKGHHHVIIDGGPIDKGAVIPKDDKHLHYGNAETGAELKLAAGKHSLTMQFADGNHASFGPEFARTISVEAVEPPAPPRVFFEAPKDGDKVKGPVQMKFGVEGFTVRPAGEDPKDHTSGHHHVLIDTKPAGVGAVVPADATHIHYGKGQTEATLELSPGKHTLTLQFADGAHRAYGPHLTETITIEVEGEPGAEAKPAEAKPAEAKPAEEKPAAGGEHQH